ADFADVEGNLRPESLEKLDTFFALCREQQLYTLPTFFVGHMSGMNFTIPWQQGGDFYTDAEVMARSQRFVKAIVSRYLEEDIILGWLLSNEITNHTGKRESHILLEWMRTLYETIRTLDPHRFIAPGDGGDDLKGDGLGYPEGAMGGIEELRQGEDLVSLHHYYNDTDTLRFSHAPAGMVRLCDIGLPVLMEEFGVSTAMWAESEQADYFRILLFTSWAAGAAGALAWCWSDFPTLDLPPYTHHPHELFFGITRSDGSEKGAAKEMRRFARVMAQVDAGRWAPQTPRAAILVPTTFYVNYPFRSVNRSRLQKTLLEAYTLARMAGFDAIFLREPALPPEGIKLLLVPFADLLAPTWQLLQSWVQEGGILWAGFGGAVPNLEELFGLRLARPQNRLVPTPREQQGGKVMLRLLERFHNLPAGEEIAIAGNSTPCLTVAPTQATVLALADDGHPALTVRDLGKGKAFFAPCSLEQQLIEESESNRWSHVYRLYQALRRMAGIIPLFEATRPSLSLSLLEDREGAQLIVATNHSDTRLQEKLYCPRGDGRVTDIESGEKVGIHKGAFFLGMEPWGVRVLKVERQEK
ncbi:MAG: cellulase family glycosylhydrolase, partial [Chloroflexi bacterium]|nr:cellulase family glycosylhydrolase [Chloroflexota bacterium]